MLDWLFARSWHNVGWLNYARGDAAGTRLGSSGEGVNAVAAGLTLFDVETHSMNSEKSAVAELGNHTTRLIYRRLQQLCLRSPER